ncbi:unnamed protein product [Adineta steineri]|uniref:Zinc-binding loop region of homing endonuclease domain-containing protein n=1 Tax=Adineta steineri TaxID=433720 RepID=A0A815Y8L4_9BILA|nr:unnamed protein product [Adineta steineri]
MSTVDASYYNEKNRRWTRFGTSYIKRLMKNSPCPTDAEKEKIQRDTELSLKIINRKTCTTQSKKQKKIVAIEVNEEKRCAGQHFLHIISTNDVIRLYDSMVEKDNYIKFIISDHATPRLTKKQIEIMTGTKPHDGPYFVKWLSCFVSETDILSPYRQSLYIARNTTTYTDFQRQITKTCKKFKTCNIALLKYHVALRSKEEDLPVLSTGRGSMHASHLYDSMHCISKEHIVVGSMEVNQSRRDCGGITLSITPATTTSTPHIKMATPCRHSINYKDSHSDDFLYNRFYSLDILINISKKYLTVKGVELVSVCVVYLYVNENFIFETPAAVYLRNKESVKLHFPLLLMTGLVYLILMIIFVYQILILHRQNNTESINQHHETVVSLLKNITSDEINCYYCIKNHTSHGQVKMILQLYENVVDQNKILNYVRSVLNAFGIFNLLIVLIKYCSS